VRSLLWLALTPAERLEAINRGLQSGSAASGKVHALLTIFLIGCSGVILIGLIWHLQKRLSTRPQARRPYRLFWRLQKHLGLGLADRLFLLMVAFLGEMRHPTIMLLSPRLFHDNVESWLPGSWLASLVPNAQGRAARIAERLFPEAAEQHAHSDR